MDSEEISKLCDRLRLDLEEPPIPVAQQDSAVGLAKLATSLVGKVIGCKNSNKEGLESVLRTIWKTKSSFQIESKGINNIFWFHFGSEEDRNFVFNGGPWLFNKQVISLIKPKGAGAISAMDFHIVPFWVQLINLLLVCHTDHCVRLVGQQLGEVIDVDCEGIMPRVKVKIDISKPLRRGLRVYLEAMKEEFTIPVQYEKLPDFCFICGLIGHRMCECPTRSEGHSYESTRKYGDWLRAIPLMVRKRQGRTNSFSSKADSPQHSSDPSVSKGDGEQHFCPTDAYPEKGKESENSQDFRNSSSRQEKQINDQQINDIILTGQYEGLRGAKNSDMAQPTVDTIASQSLSNNKLKGSQQKRWKRKMIPKMLDSPIGGTSKRAKIGDDKRMLDNCYSDLEAATSAEQRRQSQ
ncbi:Unknown protein [Striga hermonthica]|uniref:CCHC-type domain-containing protein n=1 Tax=Striga hermonthica TaxID=68872 RepID=A0A9N7MQF0_STRHE|nr:Unknown protein [Striga hermonthica]